MRVFMRPALSPIFLFMIGMLFCAEVQAAGDVLLPSDSSAPNLGLSPTVEKKSDATKQAPPAVPSEAPSAALPSLSSEPMPYTPIPKTPAVDTSGGLPTTVLKQPDLSTMAVPDTPPAAPANMTPENAKIYEEAIETLKTPYAVNVAFADKSAWGADDVAKVTSMLGIAKDKVQSLCHLSLGGILTTDKRPYVFEMGMQPQTTVKYNGALTGANLNAKALCALVPLPPNKGMVIQMGEKYVVNLGIATCAPPAGMAAKRLLVLYKGGGTGECQFQ
jgi:hypothetical protein